MAGRSRWRYIPPTSSPRHKKWTTEYGLSMTAEDWRLMQQKLTLTIEFTASNFSDLYMKLFPDTPPGRRRT